ncbi:hypothetical protein SAMN02745194_03120 [Roseomonas rosea]|uniref:Uncharacterized protein n=1 Tax=Muricoccus roseus TaxID=198092 RepID=A0A1M6LBW3_9PROT|nr:hypothetical protein [Roseomonas rosea]SHJ68711.1 hypothetical protein SAMN02745194_03120 [Roseomonas rosea]
MAAAPRKSTAAPKAAPLTRPVLKDAKLVKMVSEYALAQADAKALEARMKQLKPEIFAAMGEHPSVIVGNHVVTRAEVRALEPTPNVTITKEMVGQVIPGRRGTAGYSTLKVQ